MKILAYLYDLPNSTEGLDAIAVQTVSAVPSLTPLILVFVFFVVFLGGISRQNLRSGSADYPMWAVTASLATFLVTILMTVIEGLINLNILIIVTVITIFSAVWLFLDKRAGEV